MSYRVGTTRPLSGTARRFVPLLLIGLGAALLAAVVVAVVLDRSSAGRTESTAATVVEVTERTTRTRDTDGQNRTTITYCPTVEYTVDGEPFSHESGICTGSQEGNEVGDEVTVNYDPDDPSDAALDSWAHRWLAPLIVGGAGALFALVGSILHAAARTGTLTSPAESGTGTRHGPAQGPEPAFHRPDFPAAREGTVGYDAAAVDTLIGHIEHAYRQIAGGRPPDLTAHDLENHQLATTDTPGSGYDTATVEMYLTSVRGDLERVLGH
ncbi:DUF3592 domain-containing protein [Haloechinothrix sp. YIM 98757]|uniref:DUF3592 domain-containing protein n=1 Tax=Haloechinothrix aidingensis TaxID=2752311 RepID=A0A838A3X6_9PSEU|nr:DUF3592 domain-containing protein [Haloechinothrix aidingensis]MBA0126013.1 DUF3592 domain-containing protein [Haloechinothrix aidingensis]